MNGNENVNHEALADFLAREFATGERPASQDDGGEFDANDVAGYVRGGLLPGRRSAVQRALLQDPALREAVAFEKETLRRERKSTIFQRGLAGAIAAAVITIMILPFALRPREGIVEARELLAQGDTAGAASLLEEIYRRQQTLDTAELLALARCAHGDIDPLAGLELGTRGDWAPLSANEIRTPATVRSASEPAIGLHGSVLELRPAITIRRGAAALTLTLYRRADQVELYRCDIPGGHAGDSVVITLPSSVDDLVLGQGYGLELRRQDRTQVAHTDFKIATPNAAAACRRLAARITESIGKPTLRAQLIGNLYFRRGFYAKALATWDTIPAAERTPDLQQALLRAERLLWNG